MFDYSKSLDARLKKTVNGSCNAHDSIFTIIPYMITVVTLFQI